MLIMINSCAVNFQSVFLSQWFDSKMHGRIDERRSSSTFFNGIMISVRLGQANKILTLLMPWEFELFFSTCDITTQMSQQFFDCEIGNSFLFYGNWKVTATVHFASWAIMQVHCKWSHNAIAENEKIQRKRSGEIIPGILALLSLSASLRLSSTAIRLWCILHKNNSTFAAFKINYKQKRPKCT